RAEDGIRYFHVTGVQTCALPIYERIVEEMEIRGFKHNTPIEKPEITVPQKPCPVPEERLQAERWQLVCRWGGVYRGRPPMPVERSEERRVGNERASLSSAESQQQ